MRFSCLFASLASLALLSGSANADDVQIEAELGERIDQLFAAYERAAGPGYAIGVVGGGSLVHAGGYGLADVAGDTPITADTSFNLASLSKQMTGASIARLIMEGDLSIDDKLVDHWPALPSELAEIEIGHLVYMTSGLPEYYTLPSPNGGWQSEDRFTVDDAISTVLAQNRLEYDPGTRWSYSNINYQLLAEIAAAEAGASYAQHMRDAFFDPLGMDATWVDAPIGPESPDRAKSYVWDDDVSDWRIAPRLSPHYGGSGVFSSLSDLARWDAALYSAKPMGDQFTDIMLSTRRYEHDKTNDAFGLVHGTYRGQKTIWYEGGDYGVSTYMVRFPDRDQTVICLSNIGNGDCRGKARLVIDLLLAFDADADFAIDTL